MKIEYTSRTSVIIEHNGKKARFLGELGSVGFRAFANSMTWLLPHSRNELATEDEIKEVMKAVNLHFKGKKDSVFFVDNEGNKLNA